MTGNMTNLSTKKHSSNQSEKINHNLKKNPRNLMLQKKKDFKKKNLLRLRETGLFKTILPKKNNKNVG